MRAVYDRGAVGERLSTLRTLPTILVVMLALALVSCSKGAPRPAGTTHPTPAAGGQSSAPLRSSTGGGNGTVRQTTPAAGGYIIADPAFKPLAGARAIYGTLGGAAYEIEVPGNWNGDLVLYEHGFTGNDPLLFVQPPPIRPHLVAGGFAWAASSFSASGYTPDIGLKDSLALLAYFKQNVGVPSRTYSYGTSMGGHVVVSAMEQYPQLFDGALSECGVVMGEDEPSYLLSDVLVAQYLAGVPLYPIADVAAYQAAVRNQVLPAFGPSSSPSALGAQFENVIGNLTGGPRPWRHQGFVDRRSGNFDLPAIEDPQHPSTGYRAASNVTTRYHVDPSLGLDEGTLNGAVLRVPGDPTAADPALHPDYAPRSGRLMAPMLTLHTTGDHFVPISQERDYRVLANAAGSGDLLVQRAVRRPDHCQFSEAERTTAFDDLIGWVENGVHPQGDDFSSGDLSNVGLRFTTPLLPGDPGIE
jgi:dienelactone hydrolase